VPSLPSVLDLAGYSSEQSLPQSLHGHGPSPFIVGPGYAPISAKIVNAIVSGKHINLEDLLPENALVVDDFSEPQLLLDGRLDSSVNGFCAKATERNNRYLVLGRSLYSLQRDCLFVLSEPMA
jgi:hypothetical protein